MKLLFDENLSDRLVGRLELLYPGSTHVKNNNLIHTDDPLIWNFAKERGFTIVSKDADFYQRSLVYGSPPKLIYLRVGNCPTDRVVQLLRLTMTSSRLFTTMRKLPSSCSPDPSKRA